MNDKIIAFHALRVNKFVENRAWFILAAFLAVLLLAAVLG
jgi:hypothetical protein